MSNDNIYFAAKPAKETASILSGRANDWFETLETSGYLDKIRSTWLAYHGNFYENNSESHTISFGGEQGELTQIGVNHFRNIAQHMLNMITSTRPMMQARSINTDHKSLIQTTLANGLLDYYMREKRLENFFKTAVEYAIVFGMGYVKMEWNSTAGEVYDVDDESGTEIRTGDIEFTNLSPFDVLVDTNQDDNKKNDWVITRSFKNRFDLAAKYPEYAEEILALPTKGQILKYTTFTYSYDETDLIPMYEFFHKRTEAMPEGRYMLYLDSDIVLLDTPMPYRDLPVYAIAPSYYLGTPYGYTPMFDLLPMQDAVNSLYTTILTNQTAFGVQNILVPRGADVSVSELFGGLNVIESNQAAGDIKPLQLTATPKEVFEYLQMLVKDMETVSGVNAVARGNPDPSLRSGTALALIQSMTLQFMSGLQQAYVMMIEDVGTGIINILKDHAATPRVVTIVGKSKRSYVKEFTGDALDSVNRVVVDIGNPLARTTAGRVEMAEQMMQMGVIKTPEQYFSVIDTGQLDVMTEDTTSELYNIKGENERLVSNEEVIALFVDQHVQHIKEHSAILSDPDLRFDPELVKRVSAHIQEHINLLRTTSPELLQILGQQPLAPQPQQGAPQGQPPGQAPQGQPPDMGGAQMATVEQQQGMPNPGLPAPSQVPAELLPNPELQAQSLGNVK